MKKLYIASGMVALLAAATSCDKYDIYPEQYGKVMMIKDAGDRAVTIYATEEAQPCYISVMKSGHSPEEPAQATIKVLNDSEFGDYKEKYYGDREFPGLVALNPDFYYLGDADSKPSNGNQISHDFVDENDRYFGVNVVFDAQKVSDWRDRLTEAAEYSGKDPIKLQDKEEALDTINNYTFVVPVGLFSTTDTINSDNQYVMVQPNVENPTLSVSVVSGGYLIEDISRSMLTEDAAFREGVFEPEVTLSIPCSNPYGFSVQVNTSQSLVAQFGEFHKDIALNALSNAGGVQRYSLQSKAHFDKGVTEIRLPLSIFREHIDADQLDVNYVVPMDLRPSKKSCHMVWDDPSTVPAKVQRALKLPSNSTFWDKDGEQQSFGYYTFFVGYRVVEAPLEITEDNILSYNDCEPTEGSAIGLFDDDLSTFYHSSWSDPVFRQKPYGSYIDFEMPTKDLINAVAIQVSARVHANPVSPKVIALFYTNDYNMDNPDASSWKPFSETVESYKLTGGDANGKLGSGKVGWFGGIKKESDWIRASAPFRYMRFSVLENSNGEDITATGTKTSGYWNLAEMKIYGTVL